jgi:glycosyltransferase involved in cell wall biosynthesis
MSHKLLTIVVPSYNMEQYLRRCLDSLVVGGRDVEVIVVNDGSKDNTEKIALEYVEQYPDIVSVVTKINGGHGSTINKGLELATGEYFYVVDSDDWLDTDALNMLLEKIRETRIKGISIDLFIANCIYEHVEDGTSKNMNYRNVFPIDVPFTWSQTKRFDAVQFILLHSTVQKTSILRECGIKLPEHTFYVDNIMVYQPMPYFQTMYYVDVDLYRYFIGRNEQSVSHTSMINRIDQYVRVARIMIECYHLEDIKEPKLKKYMYKYLSLVLTIVNTFLTLSKKEENKIAKEELWQFLKQFDRKMYRKMKSKPLFLGSQLDGKAGRFIIRSGYMIGRKFFKYN